MTKMASCVPLVLDFLGHTWLNLRLDGRPPGLVRSDQILGVLPDELHKAVLVAPWGLVQSIHTVDEVYCAMRIAHERGKNR